MAKYGKIRGGRWPREDRPAFYSRNGAPANVPVLSKSGAIRGITLGRCAPCPSRSCPGYLICVDWESGQLTYPCSEGFEDRGDHIRIVAGGEIIARVVNPVAPLPKSDWPTRELVAEIEWPKGLGR